ncbi:hypothetical protein C1H46_030533 [Malus baccata]|uniref:Uncharacterized protein n=1 Tax=Malus baccata TaxID=106549 RepID=A0A540LBS7_MALBA|nr:hypothetical protein C1H46_030533 [Malus baccata]
MTTAVVRSILNHKNYDVWSSQIKTYLLAEELWDIIDERIDERPKTEDEEKAQGKALKKKDAKALYAIQNSCGDDTYELIKDETTAKGAWDTLSEELKKRDENPSDEKDERSVSEAYPTLTLIDDDTKPEVSMEAGRTEEHDESNTNDIHETFVQYVKSNDWDNAIKFLRQHRQLAGNARIPFVLQRDHFRDGTVLHYAILNIMSCSVRIIQQLVDLMASEDLEIQDCFGCTAFYHLINCYPERVEVAECMVKKNHNLLTILPTRSKKALVLVAQGRPKGESMARYLYSLTPPERLRVDEAARLIYLGFYYNRLGITFSRLICFF